MANQNQRDNFYNQMAQANTNAQLYGSGYLQVNQAGQTQSINPWHVTLPQGQYDDPILLGQEGEASFGGISYHQGYDQTQVGANQMARSLNMLSLSEMRQAFKKDYKDFWDYQEVCFGKPKAKKRGHTPDWL